MGQRLNVEMIANGESLVNAYFHWSAYTDEAISILKEIIKTQEKLDILDEIKNMPLDKKAIYLLISIGAGITPEDMHLNKYPDIWIKATNRNYGLINISEEQKEICRTWEEGRITIDIVEKTFEFDVFFEFSKEEAEEISETKLNLLKILPIETSGSYKDFEKFKENLEKETDYFICNDIYLNKIE